MVGTELLGLRQVKIALAGEAHIAFGECAMAAEGSHRRAAVAQRGELVSDADRQGDLQREIEVIQVVRAGQHNQVWPQGADASPYFEHTLPHSLPLFLDASGREQHVRRRTTADTLAHPPPYHPA